VTVRNALVSFLSIFEYNRAMITARTAVLMALRQGPGYGRELIRRIRYATGGGVRLAEGTVYPALRQLESARLVQSWTVVPGRRPGGRSRIYFELTEQGLRASAAERATLEGLLRAGGPSGRPPSPQETERRRERVALGAELSETARAVSVRPSRRSRGSTE
jgi:DNA-binding PadR family transcriptional regulator